jgi:hypothetical protein
MLFWSFKLFFFSKYIDSVVRQKQECPDCGVSTCTPNDTKSGNIGFVKGLKGIKK